MITQYQISIQTSVAKKNIQTNDQEALQIIDRYLDTFHGYHQGGTESSTQRERALIQILY